MESREFFTASDFEDLAKYAGESKDSANADHDAVYQRLKNTYHKIEYWAQQVQRLVFPEGYYQLRKRPTNQANNFQEYQWAKIYPGKNSPEYLAFTVGISTENVFEIKIDTVGLNENDPSRLIYLQTRGDYHGSSIVHLIPAQEILNRNWEALIGITADYIRSRYSRYEELIGQINDSGPASQENSISQEQTPPPTSRSPYWILKLNYAQWSEQAFTAGTNAFYHTHNQGEQPRPDYDLFEDVRAGDLVLGYDFYSYRAVICVFTITREKHNDKSLGEVIKLRIEKIISPRVPLSTFESQINFRQDLDESSARRLFSITEEVFQAIAGNTLSESEQRQLADNFLSTSSYTIGDGVEPVLGVKSVAIEIAGLIRNLKTNDVGKMIGVFGNWGRGKTFMVEQVWKVLKGSEGNPGAFIRVNFHAWKYQDTNASWAYLYEAFAKTYFEKKGNWFWRGFEDAGKRLDLNIAKHGAWPIIRFLLTLTFFGISLYYSIRFEKALWFILTAVGAVDGVRLGAKYFERYRLKEKASEVFLKYFNKPSFKDLLGIQSEIQSELRHLLECWLPLDQKGNPLKRIVLFVDDIDRCSEKRMVQLIDALRVMLEDEEISKRVIVIAAIDERMLKRAIKWKYHELLAADRALNNANDTSEWKLTTRQITSEYMDKLFLSGIKLGTLTSTEREEVYREFSRGKISNEEQTKKTEVRSNDTPAGENNLNSEDDDDLTDSRNHTQTPEPSNSNDSPSNRGTVFELSSAEDKSLVKLINGLTDATPRQIRIFYYRYMLARNLLTAALTETRKEKKYPTNERNLLMARLLIHYTALGSNNELVEDRKALLRKEPLEKITAADWIKDKEEELVAEVMEVLEMVVAY